MIEPRKDLGPQPSEFDPSQMKPGYDTELELGRKRRNRSLGLALFGFVILIALITFIRLSGALPGT